MYITSAQGPFTMFSNPSFSVITGSQVIIPVGARGFTIDVMSGIGYVNTTPVMAGDTFSWTAPDSKNLLGQPIVVGATGSTGTYSARVTVFYTT